jgi:dihydrofolate reductase
MISIIVAVGENNVIGKRGAGLLWRLPADLKHFKDLTMGHPIIMGRKTFEAIGRPLPGRTNIVITRQPDFKPEGATVVGSLDSALVASGYILKPVFVIGGGEIYAQALPLADRLYVTEVHHDFPDGDVYFPTIDKNIWREVSRTPGAVDEKNIYPHDFIIYERIK